MTITITKTTYLKFISISLTNIVMLNSLYPKWTVCLNDINNEYFWGDMPQNAHKTELILMGKPGHKV